MKKIASVLLILLILSSCGSPPPFFNRQPFQPSNPFPANGASNVSVDATLSWSCSDPDKDTLKYDIYFGVDPAPPLVEKDHPTNSWNPGTLKYNTTYYWKIVAKDGKGGETSGPVWHFTTESTPIYTLTVTTIPEEGLSIEIDGKTFTSPKTAFVGKGNHTIGVLSPQYKDKSNWVSGDDTEYVFDRWNDGNAQNPRNVYIDGDATYTASVSVFYYVDFDVVGGGGLNINSGYYAAGTSILAEAQPSSGYTFDYWEINGQIYRNNPISILVDEPKRVVAYFTKENRPPEVPSNPDPPDGLVDVSTDITLSWECSDPDGDTLMYDVYFGTDSTPPLATSNILANSYDPGILSHNTTYYWKVVAKDGKGGVTEGPVWSFTTQGMPQHTLTVTTSPETGLVIKIDGVSYTSPKSLEVEEGNHTIEVVTPQYKDKSTWVLGDDTRYEFDEWDDGSKDNPRNVYIDRDVTYTANMVVSYYVDFEVEGGGSVDKAEGYYGSGVSILVTANPSSGYTFDHWEVNGNIFYNNPLSLTINEPKYVKAVFSTENNPPNIPSNPSPENYASDVPINVTLSWSCSDPDGDTLMYDIYFGTSSSPPLVKSNHTSTTYDPGTLQYNTTYYWRIVAKDGRGGVTEGPVWRFTTGEQPNNPPNTPSDPNPADNATDVPIDVTLSWTCSDPDGDTLTYDIYFGTTSNPPLVKSNHTSTTYNPGTLSYNTTYYWKIVAKDGKGGTTEGPIWRFTTTGVPNNPPDQPSDPYPTNGSSGVPVSVTLSWACTDPDGDTLTYDIYFGTTSPPPLVRSDHTSTSYNPGTLDYGTTYYWKIVAKDGRGGVTEGPIWSFTTENVYGYLSIEKIWQLTDSSTGDNTGPIYSSPAISPDGWVYVGGQTNLYKISLSSGYYLLTSPLSPVWSSPAIDYYLEMLYVGNNNGELIIYDLYSNSLWDRIVVSPYAIYAAPLVVDDYVYVIDVNGYLYCLDPWGTLLWERSVASNIVWSSPVTDGVYLYFGDSQGVVYAVSLSDGSVMWSYSTNDEFVGGMAIDTNGNLYIAGEKLWSFTSSGYLRWSISLDSQAYANPVISRNGVIYIGTIGGTLYAIDSTDGSIIWTSDLGGSILSSCVIGDNEVIYVVSGTYLFAIKPYDGSVMDWIELENFVESNPVLHGGYIYIADESGYLYIISTLSYTISEPGESWPMFQRDWYHTGRR